LDVSFGSDEPSHLRDRVAYARHVLLVGSLALLAALALTPALATAAEDTNRTSVDFSLYFLGSSMTGDVGIGNVNADLNTSFSDVMEHLEFGAMGFGRVARDPWSFTTEVVYMGLGASKDVVSSNFEQWVVEPRVGYRVSSRLEPFLGVRYNNLSGDIAGPFGRLPSGTQDWWDPIVGATGSLPLSTSLSLVGHGDVGGLGVGSDVTWQIYPYLDWTFMPSASLQGGYRWLSVDYESGSGSDTFRWDVVTQGPQVGVTVRVAP
jgi:hypothetical protein